MTVLGIRIDNYTIKAALAKVREFLSQEGMHVIWTPNPEMLVDAQKDHHFAEILNEGDLNICDGIGISFMTGKKLQRIAGASFMQKICALAEKEQKSIYLLGSGDTTVLVRAKEQLQQQFPQLNIAGAHPGPMLTSVDVPDNPNRKTIAYSSDENEEVIHNIIMAGPDILFVGFGHGKQEKWLYEHKEEFPSVKVAMGVGGTFDFLGGKSKRAPQWMQALGVEWLYRLIREPWRIKRIVKAVIIFPCLYIKHHIFHTLNR